MVSKLLFFMLVMRQSLKRVLIPNSMDYRPLGSPRQSAGVQSCQTLEHNTNIKIKRHEYAWVVSGLATQTVYIASEQLFRKLFDSSTVCVALCVFMLHTYIISCVRTYNKRIHIVYCILGSVEYCSEFTVYWYSSNETQALDPRCQLYLSLSINLLDPHQALRNTGIGPVWAKNQHMVTMVTHHRKIILVGG